MNLLALAVPFRPFRGAEPSPPTAGTGEPIGVGEVDVERLNEAAGHLRFPGYSTAMLVLRCRERVVGTTTVYPVNGRIPMSQLHDAARSVAWAVWETVTATGPPPTPPGLSASVVVCTRDRTEDLSRCLTSLGPILDAGHEVIVVDNCPSDHSTADLVRRHPRVRYVLEPRPGQGIARNRGITESQRDVIVFTDDDARVSPTWVDRLLANFADPTIGLVTGITMPAELETVSQQRFEATNGFARGFSRRQFDAVTCEPLATGLLGAGVNMAVRRSVVDDIGLFDEALGPGTPCQSGDDHEFFYRVLARGHRAVYDPSALVWHRHRRDDAALGKAVHGYGIGTFAWWTRALVVERELGLLAIGPRWFVSHHLGELAKSALRRPGCESLELTWAEFSGAARGPRAYLTARRALRREGPR